MDAVYHNMVLCVCPALGLGVGVKEKMGCGLIVGLIVKVGI